MTRGVFRLFLRALVLRVPAAVVVITPGAADAALFGAAVGRKPIIVIQLIGDDHSEDDQVQEGADHRQPDQDVDETEGHVARAVGQRVVFAHHRYKVTETCKKLHLKHC